MGNITVTMTKHDSEKVWACIMYFAKDYEIKMHEYENKHGQNNEWQELRDRQNYYRDLAEKFRG